MEEILKHLGSLSYGSGFRAYAAVIPVRLEVLNMCA